MVSLIAHELHDEIGQVLTAINTNLGLLELATDRQVRATRLADSFKLVGDALKQVCDLALNLRPSLLDDFGLIPALERHLNRQVQRSGLAIDFIAQSLDLKLDPTLEITCFRVIQPAVTNVVRHAQATRLTVRLVQTEAAIQITFEDDGKVFEVASTLWEASRRGSIGLLGTEEGVRLAGGRFKIASTPREGTEIGTGFLSINT